MLNLSSRKKYVFDYCSFDQSEICICKKRGVGPCYYFSVLRLCTSLEIWKYFSRTRGIQSPIFAKEKSRESCSNYDVLLTMHLSVTLVIDQLNAQILVL